MILFIDDDENIRQVVHACLENFSNWEIASAASGKEGLEKIAIAKPDAILLDIMMPHMDGFEFLNHLQTNNLAHIPVILLTGRVDLSEPQKLAQIGVKGAIAKPFNPISLVSQIAEILGWQV